MNDRLGAWAVALGPRDAVIRDVLEKAVRAVRENPESRSAAVRALGEVIRERYPLAALAPLAARVVEVAGHRREHRLFLLQDLRRPVVAPWFNAPQHGNLLVHLPAAWDGVAGHAGGADALAFQRPWPVSPQISASLHLVPHDYGRLDLAYAWRLERALYPGLSTGFLQSTAPGRDFLPRVEQSDAAAVALLNRVLGENPEPEVPAELPKIDDPATPQQSGPLAAPRVELGPARRRTHSGLHVSPTVTTGSGDGSSEADLGMKQEAAEKAPVRESAPGEEAPPEDLGTIGWQTETSDLDRYPSDWWAPR
jgi:hypothetical protein